MNARNASLATALLLALSLVEPALAGGSGFADPLDTPAQASPLAARGLFNGLALAGERIVAVGQRGHILTSDDQGRSWKQAAVPLSSDLTAVSFPTAQDGWAVGQDGVVLVTHNAGQTWKRQLDGRQLGALLLRAYVDAAPEDLAPEALAALQADARRFAEEGPDKPFLDVHFSDAQHGLIVGAFNLILATSDGGVSWTPWMHRTDNPRGLHLYAIHALGEELYLAGEQGLVLRLDAATQRFQAIPLPYAGTVFGLAGDAQSTLAFGLRGNAFRSADGGRSWAAVTTGTPVTLTGATRASDGRLLLLGQTGQVLASNDGGQNFTALTLNQRVPASAGLSLADGSLLVAGPAGLHRLSFNTRPE